MAAPLVVPMTPGITVSGDYIIRVTALDAATGNVVSGVNVSAGAILANNITAIAPVVLEVYKDTLVPGP